MSAATFCGTLNHVKRYSKRPIYWLFSSPKGSFNALVYMHRCRPDTVSVVLNDYLREFRAKLEARKRHLEHVERSGETTQRDKTQAVKEITRIDKILLLPISITISHLGQYQI